MNNNVYHYLAANKRIRAMLPLYIHSYSSSFLQTKTDYTVDVVPLNHIILVLNGVGKVFFDGKTTTLTKGKILFYRAYSPIAYYPVSEDFTTCFIAFYGNSADNILEYFGYPDYLIFEDDNISNIITELCQKAENGEKEELVIANLYSLLTTFGISLNEIKNPKSFEKALAYIDENYFRDLSIDEIAEYAGISRSLLFRQFHDIKKTTVINYINSLRINWAVHLLKNNPTSSIEEISETVGFASTSYFIKCFKKIKNETPLQYKKRNS